MTPRAPRRLETSRIKLGIFFLAALLPNLALGQTLPSALKQWMDYEQNYLERTVDTRKIMAPSIANQKTQYRPESGQWFDIKSAWVPETELNVAEAEKLIPPEIRSELVKTIDGVRYFRLFVHPESEGFYAKFLSKYPLTVDYEATATASSRTLLVRAKNDPSKMFFAKVSLDVELGGVRRTILRDESARGIGTTMYLDEATKTIDPGFKFVPEVVGIIPKGWSEGGQIIRLIPPEVAQGKSTLMPLFSLYSRKPDGTMLEKLAAKAGLSPEEFVRQYIVDPFSHSWADWAVHGPVTMEAHAQNVLIELGPDGLPTKRFFMRDLGGFEIDSVAPGFKKELLADAPVFHTFTADYYPKTIEQMQTQSLSTYFEGGFLFNVDKELARIQPGYKAGAVNAMFWDRLGDELAKTSGLPRALFARAELESRMPLMIKLAEYKAAHPGATFTEVVHGALADPSSVVRDQGIAWLDALAKAPSLPPELPSAREIKILADQARKPGAIAAAAKAAKEAEKDMAHDAQDAQGAQAAQAAQVAPPAQPASLRSPSGSSSIANCVKAALARWFPRFAKTP